MLHGENFIEVGYTKTERALHSNNTSQENKRKSGHQNTVATTYNRRATMQILTQNPKTIRMYSVKI